MVFSGHISLTAVRLQHPDGLNFEDGCPGMQTAAAGDNLVVTVVVHVGNRNK
jgi:hypothetical protein